MKSGWTVVIRPIALGTALLVLLAGCAGPGGVFEEQDSAPLEVPPGLAELPDPEPRWEPRSRSGNRSPYEVFGETYHLLPTASGYEAEGLASWYGSKFHGRATASGEPYDMFELTAAHRSLPLPTYVRVTNLDNQRTTIVKVNDRGPFHPDRLIDLSYGAAVKLGFAMRGTAPVRVEVIEPERPPLLPETDEGSPLWVQAGAFGSTEAAEALQQRLRSMLQEQFNDLEVRLQPGKDALVRVRVGPVKDLQAAGYLQAFLTRPEMGMSPLIIQE